MKTILRKPRLNRVQRVFLMHRLCGEFCWVEDRTRESLRRRGLLDARGRLTVAGKVAARSAVRELANGGG